MGCRRADDDGRRAREAVGAQRNAAEGKRGRAGCERLYYWGWPWRDCPQSSYPVSQGSSCADEMREEEDSDEGVSTEMVDCRRGRWGVLLVAQKRAETTEQP